MAQGYGPGRGEEEPPLTLQNFAPQTLSAIWDNLPQLVGGALWLNFWLAPALLLAFFGLGALGAVALALGAMPGWVALQEFEGRLAAGRVAPLGSLWGAFRRFWSRAVRLGVILLLLPALTYYGGLAARGSGLEVGLLTGGILASLVVAAVVLLFAVPLLVLTDRELPQVLRDSLVLGGRQIGSTVGMAALAVLCGFATVYVSSGLIFVLPTLYGMFVVNHCRLVNGRMLY
jgi:uncharacterized membrane protein YesL